MVHILEMRWETRHASAVKDYEQKEAEGNVELVDMTEQLDKLAAA